MTTNTTNSREPRDEAGREHSSWCDWESGSEIACTCDLTGLHRALVAEGASMSQEPRTPAGKALITTTYGGRMRPREDFERLRDAIRAIEEQAAAEARRELLAPDRIEQAAIRACVAHHDEEHVAMIPPCGGARRDAEWWAAAFRGDQP